jgi:hypothetical protein
MDRLLKISNFRHSRMGTSVWREETIDTKLFVIYSDVVLVFKITSIAISPAAISLKNAIDIIP